jgi:hypothetical protein
MEILVAGQVVLDHQETQLEPMEGWRSAPEIPLLMGNLELLFLAKHLAKTAHLEHLAKTAHLEHLAKTAHQAEMAHQAETDRTDPRLAVPMAKEQLASKDATMP